MIRVVHNLAALLILLSLTTAGDSQQPIPSLPRPVSSKSQQISRDSRYPAHWWTPISKEGAPTWEILPQEAGPGEVILSKRNELGLLSNFAATPFVYEGKRYASVEGFWQMMKYPEGPLMRAQNSRASHGNTNVTRWVSSRASKQKPPARSPIRT